MAIRHDLYSGTDERMLESYEKVRFDLTGVHVKSMASV